MKLLNYFICAILLCAVVGCQSSDTVDEQPITPTLKIEKLELSFSNEAGSKSLRVSYGGEADAECTASSDAYWLKAKVSNNVIEVNYQENTTTEIRTGNIKVEYGSLSDNIKVTQSAKKEEEKPVQPDGVSQTWLNFKDRNDENILNDYSYAGYKRGEVEVPDVATLGYTTYKVTDFGAVANDGKSDREAFQKAVDAAIKDSKGGIVYFPEGVFELRAKDDPNETMLFYGSNFVIKGAGRDKTTLKMSYGNTLSDPNKLWTAPKLITIKHKSGTNKHTNITETSKKGEFSVTVASTSNFREGDWIMLELLNNDPEVVSYELGDGDKVEGEKRKNDLVQNANIIKSGVDIDEIHQIKSISGNKVTFYEPIMHEVNSEWGWRMGYFNHYENVGVEDLCFKGNAKSGFVHHGMYTEGGKAYSYDCSYSMVSIHRMVNCWMRRVDFDGVSEGFSMAGSANSSAYDIAFYGNRGHNAVNSSGSSRVFIGNVKDNASGGSGQWHAVGVSNPSIGAVIWRCKWGSDACYESHASQPRVTLIDDCVGAFKTGHQGGAETSLPNHMEDLVLWNLNATSGVGNIKLPWWNYNDTWWKLLPATVVGYHGAESTFNPGDTKVDESHGTKVHPESLYEAQLEQRFGSVPAWFTKLKSTL